MQWLYRFIVGFMDVEFKGDIAEIILNICAKNGITLWNIKRRGSKIICKITVRDFRALPHFTKRSGITVHILKKHGLPFIAKRYKKRPGIPIGAAVFFLILKFMSFFIWSVEVNGNNTIPSERIIASSKEIGIYEGIAKKKIDPQIAKQKLLLQLDGLSWASFNIEGSRLTIDVSEIKKIGEENSVATNLKSKADGKVTKIDITAGNCVVKVGDTVGKGDLLVSGIIESLNETEFVHSIGSITAKTEREITVKASYKRKISEKTGKIKHRTVIDFFGFKIPLYLGKVTSTYKSKSTLKQVKFIGKKLPIRIYKKTFYLTDEKEVTVSRKQLLEELEALLKETLKVEKISDFEIKNREYDENSSEISLKSLILAEENIAVPEPLLFNTGN